MEKYTLSLAGSSASLKWKAVRLTWDDFVKRLGTPVITNETMREFDRLDKPAKSSLKDVGGFMAGELSGAQRLKKAVMSRSMITLDVDFGDDLFPFDFADRFPGVTAAIYTTRSDRPGSRRYRLIMPFKEEVTDVTMYEAAARKVAELLGIDLFDKTTFQPERMMYWQSLSKDQTGLFEVFEGEPISAEYLIGLYGDNEEWRDVRKWAFHSEIERDTRAVINKEMAKDPRDKEGLVGAFCRSYTIPEAIEKYLSDVYTEVDNGRYTYALGSGAAGLVVYDDVLCFSHHSTDPIGDGHAYNAYDLVRVHKFGHLGKEDSTREMNKLICADKECVKDMVAVDDDLADFEEYTDEVKSDAQTAADLVWDLDRKGDKLCTVRNFVNAFKCDPLLNDLLAYDLFLDTIVYTRTPFFSKDIKKGDMLDDTAVAIIRGRIEDLHGIYNDSKLTDALEKVCSENAFHPIKKYLEAQRWDGVKRIDNFLVDYMGAEPSIYVSEAFRKMLVAAVTRVYEPGCKFDTALVMYSGQGAGKSTLIQSLSKGWFNDSLTDVSGQKAYEAIQHAWIVELAELSALRRSDVEATKNFISKREDTYRSAYARRVKTHRRQCVFFGSTNDDEFLKDKTGNRRFFPIEVCVNKNTHKLFEKSFEAVVDQLWAEAMELYMLGESLVLSDEAEAIANEGREEFTEESPLVGIIENYVDKLFPADYEERTEQQRADFLSGSLEEVGTVQKNEFCLMELWVNALGRRKEDYSSAKGRELAAAMRQLGGWYKGKLNRTKLYGRQVVYIRKGSEESEKLLSL